MGRFAFLAQLTLNHKKVQVIPTDNKIGFPPAALKRSYSSLWEALPAVRTGLPSLSDAYVEN
jgi:hypothetical protein